MYEDKPAVEYKLRPNLWIVVKQFKKPKQELFVLGEEVCNTLKTNGIETLLDVHLLEHRCDRKYQHGVEADYKKEYLNQLSSLDTDCIYDCIYIAYHIFKFNRRQKSSKIWEGFKPYYSFAIV